MPRNEWSMTNNTRLARWLAALAVTIVPLAGLPAAEQAQPSLRIVFPTEADFPSGAVVLKAALDPPGTPFERVSFYADGRLVCTVQQLPLECRWDAGSAFSVHQVRVVAMLGGDRRLTQTVRTREIGYAESVDVDLVQITATVFDGEGSFVKGLTRDAFRVYEDDKPVPITYFAAEDTPLEIVVAVDISASMAPSLPRVKLAVKDFLRALRPADTVTVLGFNDNVFAAARPSADLAARLRAVDRLGPWGGTSLYEVIVRALDMLGLKQGRRALVVFTDGEDTTSTVPIEGAETRAETSDATLYMIGQGRATGMASLKQVLDRLAKKSGGRAFFTDNTERLSQVFAQIVEELSNQYLLAYEPRHGREDTAWHRLRVELPRHNFRVRAREGYRLRSQGGL
jgi:VWFA-related protein